MDNTFIHSTEEEHMDNLMDLFKVLQKYGLKISPHKCQFIKKKIVYMSCHHSLGVTGVTLNTQKASS